MACRLLVAFEERLQGRLGTLIVTLTETLLGTVIGTLIGALRVTLSKESQSAESSVS